MIEYKGYYIEIFGFGYTVFFQGDEIYFSTETDAKEFIDEIAA